MKQFASWFTHGLAGGGALRKATYEGRTKVVVLDAVERFFEERRTNPIPVKDSVDAVPAGLTAEAACG